MAGCDDDSDMEAPRYSVQSLSVGGGLAIMYNITDNENNKLYMYKLEKEKLVLMHTVDLKNTGKNEIPVISSEKD